MPHRRLLAAAAALSMIALSAGSVTAQEDRAHGAPDATPNPVPLAAPAGDGTAVRLTTELGDIVIGLFNESAPVAAENFLNLASEGFYDGVGFHRSQPGFVLQGGDPRGDGTGGPDYRIQDEEVVGRYGRGIVAMARTQEPNSQGSQFFIVLDDGAEEALEAYRTYTIFGRVVEGMDVVDEIVASREPSDRLEDPVRITETSVEQVELPPEPTAAPPSEAELAAQALLEQLPETVAGLELQTAAFTLEQVGAQFDRDVLAELQTIAEENGADLALFSIAQAGAADEQGFVNIALASIPGVPAEQVQPAVSELLLPGNETGREETVGTRDVMRYDIDGARIWAFSSGENVWFVVSDREDATDVVQALP